MITQRNSHLIRFDRRHFGIGAAIGALIFLICWLFYSWKDALAFALLFPAVGAIRLNPRHEHTGFWLSAVWALVCLMLTCALPTAMVSRESYFAIGAYRVAMNFLCAAVVCGLFLCLSGRIRLSAALGTGALLLLSTASAFLFQFRGNLLKPVDFLAIRTAMNVAGQYSYAVPRQIALSWFVWLLAIFVLYRLPEETPPLRPLWIRLGAAGLTLLSAGVCLYGSRDIRPCNWSNEGATRNGYLLNFAVNLRDSFPGKPEGYSQSALNHLSEAYFSQEPESAPAQLPHLLVIMNESFADFSILGQPLATSQPVTPFWDSLRDNTIRGHALASVFGGGTANSEFEFLTGLSMANLPEGSCPYQQYIHSPLPSLPAYLKTLGYQTRATHPYFSSGWNRTQVYPLLGFDQAEFDESYPHTDLIRDFVSDREFYRHLLDTLESADQPLFLFGISMQNHGDYDYPQSDTYRQSITLTDAPGAYPMAEQYLSLLHTSDQALEYLLTQLEQFPEDTVVLFFGDHFPQVEGDFFQAVHGGPFDSLEEQALQYTVPFFLWANFDIPEQETALTSLNYLGLRLLETAGLPLPGTCRFLKALESAVPAINALGYYSPSQQAFLSREDAPAEEAQWLNQYAILQHSLLFDPEHAP